METWKAMAGATVVLVLFGIVVTVADLPVSGPTALVVLVVVAIASVVFYAISRRGYRFGNRLGEQLSEDE